MSFFNNFFLSLGLIFLEYCRVDITCSRTVGDFPRSPIGRRCSFSRPHFFENDVLLPRTRFSVEGVQLWS